MHASPLLRGLALTCAAVASLTLAACQDALVDAPATAAANAGGSFECAYDAYITGPAEVFSNSQVRYTLKWHYSSTGFSAPECQLTSKTIQLRDGTPHDFKVCGSGTTSGGFPYIDVCTDFAPDGHRFYVDGSLRYFNGVDSNPRYSHASRTVVVNNNNGANAELVQ